MCHVKSAINDIEDIPQLEQCPEYLQTNEPSIGDLDQLPKELIHLIFNNLSIKDLSYMAITSKILRDLVEDHFLKSNNGHRRYIPQHLIKENGCLDLTKPTEPAAEIAIYNLFKDIGLLLKRTTCLYPTHYRLNYMMILLKKLDSGFPHANFNLTRRLTGPDIRFLCRCFGYLINIMIAGWDEIECRHVFKILQKVAKMKSQMDDILKSLPGQFTLKEYAIRVFYRHVCLDLYETAEDKAFWLNLITEEYNLFQKAKLLIILYGPLLPGQHGIPYIGWWELIDTYFPYENLKDLGIALMLLHTSTKKELRITEEQMFQLMKQILRTPEPWLPENISTVIYFTNDSIVKRTLQEKLTDDPHVTANYLAYLCLVSFKVKQETEWIIDLIDYCCNNQVDIQKKKILISAIHVAFSDAFNEIDYLADLDDDNPDAEELHDMFHAIISLLLGFMGQKYQSDKINQNIPMLGPSEE